MMILRRKEIVAAALVVLIGMAGYLNWSYQDTIKVRDGESYVEAGKKIGEAQLVSKEEKNAESTEPEKSEEQGAEKTAETSADYFANAKLEKQTARAKALDILNQTAANESFDKEIRKKAQQDILDMAAAEEKETAAENIARAKGYGEVCVFLNEDIVNITVKKDGFSEADAAKLKEIAQEQMKISANKIKVVEIK